MSMTPSERQKCLRCNAMARDAITSATAHRTWLASLPAVKRFQANVLRSDAHGSLDQLKAVTITPSLVRQRDIGWREAEVVLPFVLLAVLPQHHAARRQSKAAQ